MAAVWVSVRFVPGDSTMLFAVFTSRQKAALASLGAEALVVVGEALVVVEAASSLLAFEQPETMRSPAQTERKSHTCA